MEQLCGETKVSRVTLEDGTKAYLLEMFTGSYLGNPTIVIKEYYTRTNTSFHVDKETIIVK
jgi:hypothetical protein